VWDFVRDADFEATEHAETINEHLSWLNRVDFKDWVPPALVYFKRFRQQPKLLAEFFQSLERLTYFLLVTKVGINERIETYAALTKEIEPETFKGDLAALTTLALTDAQKRKFVAALDGDVYDDLPKARMALVLRLESLVRAPGVQLQDAVSLEHVLPQTPPDRLGLAQVVPRRRRARWLDAPPGQSGSAGQEQELVCQQLRLRQEEERVLQGQGHRVALRA
jgi:hypothetical protein